jgi:cellulose binding protein with CBM2 domain
MRALSHRAALLAVILATVVAAIGVLAYRAAPGVACTATNAAWNGGLAPGASTTFGFIGSWTGSNPVPTTTCAATA